jgi:hypothetical protein
VTARRGGGGGWGERGPGVSQPQLDGKTETCHDSSSSVLSSASGEEDDGESKSGQYTQQPATLQWMCPPRPQRIVVHAYTWGRRGKDCEASYINDGCVDKTERMANSYSVGSSSFKGQKNCFSACWTWIFSTVPFIFSQGGVSNFHTEIFD